MVITYVGIGIVLHSSNPIGKLHRFLKPFILLQSRVLIGFAETAPDA